MGHRREEVFALPLFREGVAGRETPAGAAPADGARGHFLALHPPSGRVPSLILGLVATGIVKHLEIGLPAVGGGPLHAGSQVGGRLLELPISLRGLAGEGLPFIVPGEPESAMLGVVGIFHRPDRGIGAINDSRRGIGNRHLQRLLRVLEEVKDALVLEEATDELEVCLPILHAEITLGIAPLEATLDSDIFLVVIPEERHHDLVIRLALPDPAVAGEREKPEPGDNFRTPAGESLLPGPKENQSLHPAVKPPRRVVVIVDPKRHLLPHNPRRVDGGLLRHHVELEGEGARECFGPSDRLEEEDVLAERGLDAQRLVILCVLPHRPRLRSLSHLLLNPRLCRKRLGIGLKDVRPLRIRRSGSAVNHVTVHNTDLGKTKIHRLRGHPLIVHIRPR